MSSFLNIFVKTTSGNNISLTHSTGDGTDTHGYIINQTISSGETCNIDFNGDGNSEEDDSGNDLAAIIDGSVTNLSNYISSVPTAAGASMGVSVE